MKRFLKLAALTILALIFVLVVGGVLFQQVATWRDSRRFQQQGKSIALGSEFPGVSLNLDCSGSGSPTVIMDSGLGVPAIGWYMVQPEVAKFARVCSYDRAGYGWSTPGPLPRTSDQIVKELHALLGQSGEKGPYVFVAHSFGGFNVRLYASRYPAEVSGLVLVDCSEEDQISYLPPDLKKFMAEETSKLKSEVKLAPLLINSGLARIMDKLDSPKSLPLERRREFRYSELQTKYIESTASEMLYFDESASEVRRTGSLGDRPLVVLTAGKTSEEGIPSGIDRNQMAEFQQTWIHDLQVREAHLSTRGKQILVPNSTHMIPIEQPQPIIDAIREVVQTVRVEASAPAAVSRH